MIIIHVITRNSNKNNFKIRLIMLRIKIMLHKLKLNFGFTVKGNVSKLKFCWKIKTLSPRLQRGF